MCPDTAKKIKKRRSPKKTPPLQLTRKIQCPQCKTLVPDFLIMSIRGQTKCIKCHVEDVWCFTEENRRQQMKLIDKVLSVNWEKE